MFSIQEVSEFIKLNYNLTGELLKLPGESDDNYLFKPQDDKGLCVCKLSSPVKPEIIAAQLACVEYLVENKFPYTLPESITSLNGQGFILLREGWTLRLQKYVPGRLMKSANPRSSRLLKEWGRLCGNLSKYLQNFERASLHFKYKWNPSNTLDSRAFLSYLSKEEQVLANEIWEDFEKNTLPVLSQLRKSINYNDAHEQNIIISTDSIDPGITGLIDFGDILYCETINELAIACAYAGMGCHDPLSAIRDVVRGFHEVFPIEENEIDVLPSLITARLLITVTSAAYNKRHFPENKYLTISETDAWNVLNKLIEIPSNFIRYVFRTDCGFKILPKIRFEDWIASGPNLHAIMSLDRSRTLSLDLSVGSTQLGNSINYLDVNLFERRINRLLEDNKCDVAIGGYGEVRPIYTTEEYALEGNNGQEWRTVHLGMDVWNQSGTAVYAPLKGVVCSVANNRGYKNYGPTLILEHKVTPELTFYTLYGHLRWTSIQHWCTGDEVGGGDKIGEIGDTKENGAWPPHVHIQIILDMLGNREDFPGVSFPRNAEAYQAICPDPTCFFDFDIKSNNQIDQSNLLKLRKKLLGQNLSVSYEDPLQIVRGYKQYLFDLDGRRYLDTVNNVAHVGHEHPDIVACLQEQAAVLNTNTRYIHNNITYYADKLLRKFPPELCVVYFTNSGSEANELALRMVEAATNSKNMIVLESGYHGNTTGAIDISSYKFDGVGGFGAPENCQVLPCPDIYAGLHASEENAGEKYAHYVHKALNYFANKGHAVGGFIGESILSCAGQIVLPDNYLNTIYKAVRAAGGLCIADEVQVGFGRVGQCFWGFELQHVVPDIVTLGKPIGNGHPVGAVVTTRAVADAFANGMEYFNTFSGNPVSCAVGSNVLDVIEKEELQNNALEIGALLYSKLKKLKDEFQIVGDIRGHGLFLGIELVKNRNTKTSAAREARYLVNRMRSRGILMSVDGPRNNVIKIKPPLCIQEEDIDYLIKNLKQVLGEDAMSV